MISWNWRHSSRSKSNMFVSRGWPTRWKKLYLEREALQTGKWIWPCGATCGFNQTVVWLSWLVKSFALRSALAILQSEHYCEECPICVSLTMDRWMNQLCPHGTKGYPKGKYSELQRSQHLMTTTEEYKFLKDTQSAKSTCLSPYGDLWREC